MLLDTKVNANISIRNCLRNSNSGKLNYSPVALRDKIPITRSVRDVIFLNTLI